MKIRPLGTRLVVKVDKPEKKTPKGIVIPDKAKEKPAQGEVVVISEELLEDYNIKIGDKVIFDKFAGTPVMVDNEEYLVLFIDDVIAIIEE